MERMTSRGIKKKAYEDTMSPPSVVKDSRPVSDGAIQPQCRVSASWNATMITPEETDGPNDAPRFDLLQSSADEWNEHP